MEDVIQTYMLRYDPKLPVVCFDEASKQLFGEVRPPESARRGVPIRVDYEYERKGVCCQLVMCEPLRGWRHVVVTERRTRRDYAHCIGDLVDRHFPRATKIRLVQDNLNTHDGASLYEAFSPEEASDLGQDRVPLHPQARQLAEYGGDGDQHHEPPVLGPTAGQSGPDCRASGGLGKRAELSEGENPLDFHTGRSSSETP
jgi:hypothetical protein